MSDFFTRLAEKALGAAPPVRPVISPIFSPEPGVSGSFIEATEWVGTDFPRPDVSIQGDDPTVKSLQAPSTALPGPELLRRQPPPPHAAAEPSTSASTQPTTGAATPTLKPERVLSLLKQRQDAEGQSAVPWMTETAQNSPALDTPTSPARLDRQVILVPVPSQGGDEGDSAIRHLETEAEFDRSSDLQPHQQISEPQAVIHPAITPTRRQQESSTPRVQPRLETQGETGIRTHLTTLGNQAEIPVEPTIRVTIGRVDVRLVQPPTAAKPAPTRTATAQALSLDEYLKKRSEGRQ